MSVPIAANVESLHEFYHKFVIKISYLVLHSGLWFFALIPISKIELLNVLHAGLWVVFVIYMLWYAFFHEIFGDEFTLNGLLTFVIFITKMFGHLTITINSFKMRRSRKHIKQRLTDITMQLSEHIDVKSGEFLIIQYHQSLRSVMLIVSLIVCHIAIIGSTFNQPTTAIALYWRSFLSTLALQFKMLEFLSNILHAHCYQNIIYCILNRMGEDNYEHIFQTCSIVKQPKNGKMQIIKVKSCANYVNIDIEHNETEAQLYAMKRIYSEFFEFYKLLNDAYGWSLLAFTLVFFNDFVSNSYYIFLSVITQELSINVVIQNGGYVAMALILLSGLCWYCQQSDNYSRKIGCLICKLVKPLGNKRYNDLVTEFSLQTLHQRFVVTAKDFFALNLNLLGTMVAAIVTYLVILIQFMFTEKNNKDRAATALVFFKGATTINSTV